ncbi:MAG: 50S ribosomal protein L11 methyltransferase [Syntrophothermus sp.]
MRKYKEFTVRTSPFLPEVVSGLLWNLDITGLNEEDDLIKAFADEKSSTDSDSIYKCLEPLKNEGVISDINVDVTVKEEINWNEEWEKTINVIEVSDRIVIKPSFRPYDAKPGQLILTIDPKMSFGTGEHQTTKLVLRMVESYVKPGMTVLDVGTGTSVLAIAAVKLGASHAVAFDNDEWCYDNGIENCQLNNASEQVDIRLCEIKDIEKNDFDLLLANINKHILMDIAEDIRSRLKKGGQLILSGLLYTDEPDIVSRYTALNLEFIEKRQMDEWITIAFKAI